MKAKLDTFYSGQQNKISGIKFYFLKYIYPRTVEQFLTSNNVEQFVWLTVFARSLQIFERCHIDPIISNGY